MHRLLLVARTTADPGGGWRHVNTTVLDEAELVTAARFGDREAFAELYRRFRPAARATAAALRVSRFDRDDVVDEAFANILSAFQRGNGPVDSFRPYLVAAVRNLVYNQSRRNTRADEGCRRLTVDLMRDQLTSAEFEPEPLHRALEQLPQRWQHILQEVEVDGRRPAELAGELGMSANAVAALSSRARRGLRTAYLEEVRKDSRQLASV